MKEKITICNRKENGNLTVIGEKFMTIELNESDMELYAKLEGKSYKVQGNIYCQFIQRNNMHTQLIATELSSLGFTTRITQTGVLVSLNRPVSSMEVETALEQVVEGVKFNIYPISKNIQHVITEE